MSTWGQQLEAIKNQIVAAEGKPVTIDVDTPRREALAALAKLTGRPAITYVSRWSAGGGRAQDTAVEIGDLQGFMEILHGLKGPCVDLVLHTSGGSPTAAAAIVDYLRTKFLDVRIIVPLAAMSAGTLMACSANRIVMGKHSYLGPTDPQFLLQTKLGVQSVAAHAILEQFAMAQADAANPAKYAAWIPMLEQYGPGLIVHCKRAIELSHELAATWLSKYMFAGQRDAETKAESASKYLASQTEHKVHGRYLSREKIREIGIIVDDLEDNQLFQDAALSVFHACSLTFTFTPAQKILENNEGRSYIRMSTEGPKPPGTRAADPETSPQP